MSENNLINVISELSKDIYRTLGSGHLETAYQKAMEVGLRLQRVKFEAQKVMELTYKDHYIGIENLDLLVEQDSQKVIVELKAAPPNLGPAEKQQILNYMKTLGVENGVLINFPQPGRKKNGLTSPNDPEIITLPESPSAASREPAHRGDRSGTAADADQPPSAKSRRSRKTRGPEPWTVPPTLSDRSPSS